MKRSIIFLLSICVLLFSCSDGDDPVKEVEKPPIENKDPFITLKKSNIDFTNEGGSESILIESNVTWTTKSSAGWCTVSPTSGNKSTTSITLSAPANKEYDNRSCTVTLEGGGITKTITVNQGENLGLLVTQNRYELSNEESTIKVEVKANVEFEVEINDEWITQVETRGLTTSQIEFKIAENDSYSNREGSITIKQKGGNMSSTITIFQSQEDAIILSEKDFDLSNEAQSVEVEVKTNIDYEIIIPEDAKEWVSHSTTRALRTETVVLDIAQNMDYDERTAKIVVKDKKSNLQETVTIKQATNRGLIVSDDKYEVTNDGGIIEVEVKANVDYKVTINDSWITQIETRGLTTTNLSFEVAKNESYSNREGSITISQTDGNLSSTITVYQSQENAIILSDKDVEISDRSQTLTVVIKTNVDIGVTIQEVGKGWVSYTPTRGLREETISLNISANNSDKDRSTKVYFKDKLSSLQETLTINQIGKEPGVYYVDNMGTLSSVLNQTQKDTITTMIVKGEINKHDFYVMNSYMPRLKHIDLTDVKCDNNEIPYAAFSGNKIISTIKFPLSITKIGAFAFNECTNLKGPLNLPNKLTSIDQAAFQNCTSITGSLIIPDGITTIEAWIFNGCSGFNGTLTLPSKLTKIKNTAFQFCSGFNGTLTIPDGVTSIEEWAFNRCLGFTGTLKLPKELISVDRAAFQLCEGFTSLDLNDKLVFIGENSFALCSNINGRVTMPRSLKELSYGSFLLCNRVGSFQFPHVPPLEYKENMLPQHVVVEVPYSAVTMYRSTYGWHNHNIAGYY